MQDKKNKFARNVIASAVLMHGGAVANVAIAETGKLEEVTVTAEKKTESLQETPISITAVTGEAIEKFALDDLQGINAMTPGMAYSRAGGEPQIYIRGIGTSSLGVTVDASVAVHADGVYLGRSQMGLSQFLDLERVEVLRGPQGTLYGRNATAGAINLISKKPTEELDGYVRAGIGSFGRTELTGAVSGELTDSVRGRFASRQSADDGFTKDIDGRGGRNIDDNDLSAYRGMLDIDLSDSATLSLIGEWSDFSSNNRTIRPLDNLGLAETLGAVPPSDFDKTRNNLDTFYDWETGGLTAALDWQLSDGIAFSSITAYRSFENDFLFNTDGTEAEVTRTSNIFDTEQYSQELRFSSTSSDPLQWMAGLFYLREDKKGALGLARATLGMSFYIPNEDTTDAYAAFGEASYAFTDALVVKLGLRYSSEEKSDVTYVGAVMDLDGLYSKADPVFFGAPRDETESWDAFTPRLVVEYDFAESSMAYLSISEGFKSGGWNAFDRNPSFEPEQLLSVEAGVKLQAMDDRIRFNAAVFNYDYDDLQVNTFINGLATTTNAASASVTGFEADVTALVGTALTLRASYALIDSEYKDFCSPFGVWAAGDNLTTSACDQNPEVGATRVVDLTGNTLTNAPEHKLTSSVQYDWLLAGGGEVSFLGQATYQDKVYFSQFNEDIVGQDAFTLWDANITYTAPGGQWQLSAYGKNLADEEYVQNVVRFTSTSDPAKDVNAIGNALGYPAPGRTWGLQATYNF